MPKSPTSPGLSRLHLSRRALLGTAVAAAVGLSADSSRSDGLRWSERSVYPDMHLPLWVLRNLPAQSVLRIEAHGPSGSAVVYEEAQPKHRRGDRIWVALPFPDLPPEPGVYRYQARWIRAGVCAAQSEFCTFELRPFRFGC